MNYENILLSDKDGIVTVTINRPKMLNAFNTETLLELESVFKELENENTNVVIITGAGDKAFVAGADVLAMSTMTSEQAKNSVAKLGQRVFERIENFPNPVIAAVNGYALGGGCELAMVCDIRIASNTATFGLPEINLGIICGWGATQRLVRLIGIGQAKELLFLGKTIDTDYAEKIGLVNGVVPADKLLNEVMDLAYQLSKKPPVALTLLKKAINKSSNVLLPEGLQFETECFSKCFATQDQKEGMDAFLNKRKPSFVGK